MPNRPEPPALMQPAEAAKSLGVSPRTLTRWADEGLIAVVVLPSGHRRYRAEDVEALRQPKAAS